MSKASGNCSLFNQNTIYNVTVNLKNDNLGTDNFAVFAFTQNNLLVEQCSITVDIYSVGLIAGIVYEATGTSKIIHTIINGTLVADSYSSSVFYKSADITLENVTSLTYIKASYCGGFGIFHSGSLSVTNCTFKPSNSTIDITNGGSGFIYSISSTTATIT